MSPTTSFEAYVSGSLLVFSRFRVKKIIPATTRTTMTIPTSVGVQFLDSSCACLGLKSGVIGSLLITRPILAHSPSGSCAKPCASNNYAEETPPRPLFLCIYRAETFFNPQSSTIVVRGLYEIAHTIRKLAYPAD